MLAHISGIKWDSKTEHTMENPHLTCIKTNLGHILLGLHWPTDIDDLQINLEQSFDFGPGAKKQGYRRVSHLLDIPVLCRKAKR